MGRVQVACCTWVGMWRGWKVHLKYPSALSTTLTSSVMVKGIGEASTASCVAHGVAQTGQMMLDTL